MKAVYKNGKGELEFRKVKEPHISEPDDVKIKILYSSIGPEEMLLFNEGDIRSRNGIIGYEMMGKVVQAGDQAVNEGFKVGLRVSGTPILNCGTCHFCKRNMENSCINLTQNAGTMTEYIVLKSKQLIVLDDYIGNKEGCLVEPIAGMIQAVETIDVKFGCNVLILGNDFLSMVMIQLIRMKGVSNVTVAATDMDKSQLAMDMGANHVVDIFDYQSQLCLYKETGFIGYNLVIDTLGNSKMVLTALDFIARGGKLLLARDFDDDRKIPLSLNFISTNNISIIGSFLYRGFKNKLELSMKMIPLLNLQPLMTMESPFVDAIGAIESVRKYSYPRVFIKMNK